MKHTPLNINLVDCFDASALTGYELSQYITYMDKYNNKVSALEALIGEVNGDYMQLSRDLEQLAIKLN